MLQIFSLRAIGAVMAIIISINVVSAKKVEAVDSVHELRHELGNVSVTAVHSYSKVASTTTVQVLTNADFKKQGLQNVGDAVKRFAGTNVRDYGGIGGLKTVSVRNLGAAHTAVSYDGVAVSNCQAGQIDVGRFSLDNVSSLSLAVGHDDELLQSARLYASAGVLKIETEKPYFENKSHYSELKLGGGSFGLIAPSFRHWHKFGKATSVVASASYLRADGNYPFMLENGKLTGEERRQNSDIESYQGELNVFHSFSADDEMRVKAYYFKSERGLPGAVVLYNNHSDERLWDENFFMQARYKKTFSPKVSLLVQGKYNYAWNKYVDEGVEYVGGKQTDINRQNEYYISGAMSYKASDKIDISLSQDGAINKLNTNGVNGPDPLRYTSLTALNARYHSDRLKVLGTLVGTYITDGVETGTKPEARKRLSPAVSVSYRLLENQQLYVRGMYKNTFRVPTFTDLYYLRVGNTNLKPEKATEYTAGITWSGRNLAVVDYMSITVDGYYNRVNDKIIAFPSTYVWKMQNYGKVNIYGVDATLAIGGKIAENAKLNVTANYSWQKAVDVTNKDAKNYKHQLPYTPEHSGNVSLVAETTWLNVGYSVGAVGKRYYLAQNIKTNEIAGYCEHTATIWREFKLKTTSLRVQAEVINLTDAQYDVIKYYPMPGRSWRLTGIFKF